MKRLLLFSLALALVGTTLSGGAGLRAQNAPPAAGAIPPKPPIRPLPTPAQAPAKTNAELADELFDRLAKTEDPDEAAGIVGAIERLWLRSGSDTSDLLMSRAVQAMGAENYPLALSLLDTIVQTQPDWAEGWNKRATARYFSGDPKGSMADIAETLKRNPRHIGALSGLSAILDDAGLHEDALRAVERGLALAPHYQPLVDAAGRLKATVAGQSL